MLLEKFSLPKTDVRLVLVDGIIFKISVHLAKEPGKSEESYQRFCSNPKTQEEIEKIIMTLLMYKTKPLEPIRTDNLTVYSYRQEWRLAKLLLFYKDEMVYLSSAYEYSFYAHCNEANTKTINQAKSDRIPAEARKTKQAPCHSHGPVKSPRKTEDGALRIINKVKFKPGEKMRAGQGVTKQTPRTARNTGQKKKCPKSDGNLHFSPDTIPESPVEYVIDSDSDDNESTSIQSSYKSFPKCTSQEKLSDSLNESLISMAKDDTSAEKMNSFKQIELIPTLGTQRRKRHGESLDEVAPKKSYSVAEYSEANRHDVQEQDLQEQLRFQELATPAEEKPATVEKRPTSLQRAISSVKRMVFG